MKTEKRKSVTDELGKYCYLAETDDVVEITEWTNGEGYDIYFSDKDEMISLSHGKIEAITFLTKAINYCSEEYDDEFDDE